jgi:hypothetical protein
MGNPSSVLADIDRLKDTTQYSGWDSYNADPVGLMEREGAKSFVRALFETLGVKLPRPIVSPISDSGVALIWRASGREVDAHFTPRGATYLVLGADRRLVENGKITDSKMFSALLLQHIVDQR